MAKGKKGKKAKGSSSKGKKGAKVKHLDPGNITVEDVMAMKGKVNDVLVRRMILSIMCVSILCQCASLLPIKLT